jgi:hypothetical protein
MPQAAPAAILRPTYVQSYNNPWVILVLVCLAQFMVILDATIVNVPLPSIRRERWHRRVERQS